MKLHSTKTDSYFGIIPGSLKSQQIYQATKYLLILTLFLLPFSKGNAQKHQSSKYSDKLLVKQLPGFNNAYINVNGIKLHYVSGGAGKVLVLLPGWPENWWSYHKIMPELAKNYQVIALDYRGMGSSDKPESGYDKKTIANDISLLLNKLGIEKAYIAGHDIGAQVAFSFAANHPEMTEKLVIMDVPHPDESFSSVLMLPALGTPTDKLDASRPFLWWFAFNQMKGMPEELLADRFEIAQKYIFHYLLQNDSSINKFDRAVYTNAYNAKDAIRAGNAWYQAFSQDIADYKTYQKLAMPVLGLGGPGYDWLRFTLPNKTTNSNILKIEDSGHFIAEEQPKQVIEAIVGFLK